MPGKFEQWAWVVEEEDGTEGVIAAIDITGVMPMVVLVTRQEELARGAFKAAAEQHHRITGRPIRLVHLREVSS